MSSAGLRCRSSCGSNVSSDQKVEVGRPRRWRRGGRLVESKARVEVYRGRERSACGESYRQSACRMEANRSESGRLAGAARSCDVGESKHKKVNRDDIEQLGNSPVD